MNAYSFSFKAMGGPCELQLWSELRTDAEFVAQEITSCTLAIEQKYSRYREDSLVTKINRSAGSEPVEVDSETAALIDYAQTCYFESDGLFDLTSGILRQAWNFKPGATLPNPSQIEELLPQIGWDKIEWKRPFIYLQKAGMEIDFGGIGKEYAVDRAAAICLARDVKRALINFAGDVRVVGKSTDAGGWRIGIVHPREPGQILGHVELNGGALTTSGDYERFIEVQGVRYCHILNPKTGYPVKGLRSVTVLSESCLVAGTASTIAMLYGTNGGVKFLKKLGVPYLVVNDSGELKSDKILFQKS